MKSKIYKYRNAPAEIYWTGRDYMVCFTCAVCGSRQAFLVEKRTDLWFLTAHCSDCWTAYELTVDYIPPEKNITSVARLSNSKIILALPRFAAPNAAVVTATKEKAIIGLYDNLTPHINNYYPDGRTKFSSSAEPGKWFLCFFIFFMNVPPNIYRIMTVEEKTHDIWWEA